MAKRQKYGTWLVVAWSLDYEGCREEVVARSVEYGSEVDAVLRFAERTGYKMPVERLDDRENGTKVEAFPLDPYLAMALPKGELFVGMVPA